MPGQRRRLPTFAHGQRGRAAGPTSPVCGQVGPQTILHPAGNASTLADANCPASTPRAMIAGGNVRRARRARGARTVPTVREAGMNVQLLIDGEGAAAAGGGTFERRDPVTDRRRLAGEGEPHPSF